ncbi:MAG: DNA mismatch repair protein MutS [Halobacteriota archaeon]
MTTPTGPPETMVAKRAELTPMLGQYLELCEAHADALVLFQVGDFYEAFCEAAEAVARVCEVTLTKREDSTGTYPMAGIPIDSAASYLDRLLDAGYRIALADQVEDAAVASGLVDRAVTQVITPGTIVDEELLEAGSTNYLAAVCADETGADGFAIAALDVSTGECFVTAAPSLSVLSDELDRIDPAELLVGPAVPQDTGESTPVRTGLDSSPTVSRVDRSYFDRDAAIERLEGYVSAPDRRFESRLETRACGAVLGYAEYTQGDDGPLSYVSRIRRYDRHDRLELDAAALSSLELFENRGRGSGRTLFETLDATSCALGRRCLTRWLRRPLVDRAAIERRLDAVESLAADSIVREELRESLATAYDLERLVGRISRRRANARDLRSLHATLSCVPSLRASLSSLETDAAAVESLIDRLDPLAELAGLIDRAIRSDPPIEITEGGVICEGFDEELDGLRSTERAGREWIAALEASERERTGIDSLSVGHNSVHGYYIEVTNPNLDRVPAEYTRRQTLKNAERFYTPELKDREDEILGAAERADSLEYELFRSVRADVAAATDRIQALAEAIAELDALCSLATVTVERDYVRPTFHEGEATPVAGAGIEIEGGRHPVVETTEDSFVPNDTDLPKGAIAIVTGPNMSGKSTYMRQVALVVLLAQLGSFVPAEAARLPIVDRIFTRVGASDDIAGGQSTFMREMTELTEILHDATEDSLVLLDEVGRGTSTADGRAIAEATTEYIHDELGAMTLFATHYHELTDLSDRYDGVFNLHFAATREGDEVTFLHRVARGGSSSSYGIEVARMAGVPGTVVDRAYAIVETDSPTSSPTAGGEGAPDKSVVDPSEAADVDDRSSYPEEEFFDGVADPAVDAPIDEAAMVEVAIALRAMDVGSTTPLEALNTLDRLRSKLQ